MLCYFIRLLPALTAVISATTSFPGLADPLGSVGSVYKVCTYFVNRGEARAQTKHFQTMFIFLPLS